MNSLLILFTVRPVITVPDLRIFIRPGEDVSLECIFEFHPRGLMWWERESGEILSRNDKYSVADFRSHFERIHYSFPTDHSKF